MNLSTPWTLYIFCGCFIVHLLIWRICLPIKQTKTLLKIFFVPFVLMSFQKFFLVYESSEIHFIVDPNYLGLISSTILFTSMTLAYIVFYSALEVDSPTVVIMSKINSSEGRGLTYDDLNEILGVESLIGARINDLIRDGFVTSDGTNIEITEKGIKLASLTITARKVLGLPL